MLTSLRSPSLRISILVAIAAAVVAALAVLGSGGQSRAAAGGLLNFPGPGTGYIEVPDADALDPGAAFTLEAWVNLRSYAHRGSAPFCPTIAGKDFEEAYWLGVCDGRMRVTVKVGTVVYTLDGQALLPLNTWTHVAGVFDGSEMRLYVNAVLDTSRTIPAGPVAASTDALQIGHDVTWDATPDGLLDEVRLWNVARIDMQIANTMSETITTPTAGLVAAWNMEGNADDVVGALNGTPAGDAEFVMTLPTPTPSPTPSPSPVPTATPVPTPTPVPEPERGDINCDDTVDSLDALTLLRYEAGLNPNLPPGCPPLEG